MQQPGGADVGSNGTDLGVPNGDFFQYTWSDEATQGTWSQVATDLGDQLPTGDYNSLEPLDQLIGCDLNGTWQLEITDLWGGDAGELSEWFLTFDPTIIPDVTEFTPSIGEESDSTFWTFDTTNLDVQFESTDGNEIVAYPLEVGDYAFNYTVLNSHGCNYDSTLTITVEQPGLAEAGPDVTFCGGGDTQLLGGLQGQPPASCVNDGGNHTFCYDNGTVQSLTYCPDNPGDGFTFIDITFNAGSTENFFDEFYVYDGDSDAAPLLAGPLFGDLSGMQFIATNPTGCLTISVDPDNSVSCTSGSQTEWNFDVSCGAGGPQFIYEWAPTDGLSDPNIATPYVTSLNGVTTYTLTAYPEGHPDCVSTDTATVNPAFDFTMEANEPSCLGNDGFIDVWVDENSGPGPWTIEMTEAGMAPITEISLGGTTTFGGLFPGNYDVSIESGGCIYNQNFDILGAPPLTFETSNDTIICIGGIAPLAAWSDDDIDNSWTYTWDNGLGQGAAVNASPVVTTTYEVYTTDDFGCDSAPIQILVEVRDPITVEFVAPSELCAGADATLDVINTNGGSFAPYSYDSGELFTNNEAITGEYCVLAYDGCETPPGEYCQTVEIEAAVPVAFEADTTMGCFPAVINFTNLSDPTLFVDQYWFYGDGNASEGADPSHIYENPGLYDVRLQLRSALGCLYDANYG
ncbi:MAG: PKD domain-containing protein, partial [Flavobacteriales bacterium]